MAKGKPSKKSKHKGQSGNHADVEKKMWKRSVKHNAAMANAAPAFIPVPVPVPVPASLLGPVPRHFPAHVPTLLRAPPPPHVPLWNGSPSDNEADAGEGVAGFIFMCSVTTKPECYRYRVFGLPKGKMDTVEKIKMGAKLFLFDFDLKLLYGIYEALGNGGESLEPAAFGGSYPAQVRFSIAKDCLPLPEAVFKHVIPENYRGKKFSPELNFEQVKKLQSLFQEIPLQQTALSPALTASRHPAAAQVPAPYRVAAPSFSDNRRPMPSQLHPHELYVPHTLCPDDRERLPVSHDPHRAIMYAARVPTVAEPPRTSGTAGHPVHVQLTREARTIPPTIEAYHPTDPWRNSEPYHLPDPRGAYLPHNQQEQELVGRYLGGREARASPPQADYHNPELAWPPGSNSTSDYYRTQHLGANALVRYSSQSSALQAAEPSQAYYSTPQAASALAAEMRQPPVAHPGPVYYDPNHMYAYARPALSADTVPHASSTMHVPGPAYR